jgi:glucose/arabinose dehydrogenase
MKRILLLPLIILLSACTLTIGWPSRLPDQPGPTAIPLTETAVPLPQVPGKSIVLPAGFRISVFADGLDNPRMMAMGPDGHIYVAERGAGRILRLPDADRDGILDQIEIVAEGLRRSPDSRNSASRRWSSLTYRVVVIARAPCCSVPITQPCMYPLGPLAIYVKRMISAGQRL